MSRSGGREAGSAGRARRPRWGALWVALLLVVLVLLGASAILGHAQRVLKSPIEGLEEDALVVIAEGSDFSATMRSLEGAGLVTHPLYFRAMVWRRGADTKVRAGRYEIPVGSSPSELLDRITGSGPGGAVRLTVPEGWTMYHIADRVEASGIVDRGAFLAAATDPALLKALGVRADSFEGYLYPDTYFFSPGVTAEGIIRRMVGRHREVWAQLVKKIGPEVVEARGREHRLTARALLILASLVEREAVVDEERPIIARVFLNRLERKMKLQCDPTCIYGPDIYKEKPSPALCRDKASRYSTYVIKGLPPGPVANPGRTSLQAVLAPTEAAGERDFLYFVAKPGGRRHTFSKTYEAHQEAIPR